jgi:hypothetical protein
MFFNNQNLAPNAVMGSHQVRYMSLVPEGFPVRNENVLAADNAVFEPDGSWVTVMLPQDPALSRSQKEQVRARAAELGYNVLKDCASVWLISCQPLRSATGLWPLTSAARTRTVPSGVDLPIRPRLTQPP